MGELSKTVSGIWAILRVSMLRVKGYMPLSTLASRQAISIFIMRDVHESAENNTRATT